MVNKCLKGHYQPLLLLYADPDSTTINVESAPQTTTIVQGLYGGGGCGGSGNNNHRQSQQQQQFDPQPHVMPPRGKSPRTKSPGNGISSTSTRGGSSEFVTGANGADDEPFFDAATVGVTPHYVNAATTPKERRRRRSLTPTSMEHGAANREEKEKSDRRAKTPGNGLSFGSLFFIS